MLSYYWIQYAPDSKWCANGFKGKRFIQMLRESENEMKTNKIKKNQKTHHIWTIANTDCYALDHRKLGNLHFWIIDICRIILKIYLLWEKKKKKKMGNQ